MRDFRTIYTIILAFSLFSCQQEKSANEDTQFGKIRDAKGYYNEGDKKFKIFEGGVFRTNETNSFQSLFPISINHAVSSRIALQVYQGLVKLNKRNLKVEPLLAESISINDDGTLYTFNLRDSVFFHDDPCFPNGKGRMLNAHDVKYCFDQLCSSIDGNRTSSYFTSIVVGAQDHYTATAKGEYPEGGVKGVKVVDDFTIAIELVSSYSYFLKILSQACCTIYPKEAYDKYGLDLRAHTVGTGPFTLKNKDINENVELRMVRNDNYWENDEYGNPLPYLDVIKISFNNNKKIELTNFKKGNIDMVYQLPVEELEAVLVTLDSAKNGGNPEFKLQSNKDNGLSSAFYCFNLLNPIFQDIRIRKAFNHAIDREKIVKYILKGESEPAVYGFVPSLGEYDHTNVDGFTFNPDLAQKLLADAGYPAGEKFPELELDISESNYLNIIVAEAIQKMLYDNLGINIKINYFSLSVLIDKFNNAESDFFGITWQADYPDPQNFLQIFNGKVVPEISYDENGKPVISPSYTNCSRYQNSIFDDYYDRAIHAKSQDSAMHYYYKADSLLIADAALIPIYYGNNIRLIQNNVHALPINNMEYRDFTRVFLSKE